MIAVPSPSRLLIGAALTLLGALPAARATVSFDLAVDRLENASGTPVGSGALVLLVADTDGDGLAQAVAGSIAVGASLDGPAGDDLIVFRSNLSSLGVGGGALGAATGGLALGGDWSPGDPLYLVWFPDLTIAQTSLVSGQPYGARGLGVTPADGASESLVYLSPTQSGAFGSSPVPGNATVLASNLASRGLYNPPTVIAPSVSSVGESSATLGGSVSGDDGDPIVQRGVVYSVATVNSDPLVGGSGVSTATTGGTLGTFTIPVSGLSSGTTYAFRAFAANSAGPGHSAAAFFTTDTQLVLSGGLASVARGMRPGDLHRFHFTLTGTQSVDLSTGGVPLKARLYDAQGQLIAELDVAGAVSFANLALSAGTYTLELSRDPGEGPALAYTLDLDASESALARPDEAVGSSLTTLTGEEVYSPTSQQLVLASPSAGLVTGYVAMRNRGNVGDRVRISGTAGNSDFAVTYYDNVGGNITAQVLAGTYESPELAPVDDSSWIRVTVKPTWWAVILRRTRTFNIVGHSVFDSGVSDAVSIQVNTR